jgi:choline dehydrogenase-like flavoprotein
VGKLLSFLFKATWLKTSPSLGPVLGYPRAPVHGTPGTGFDYEFLQFPPGSGLETVETDVLVVGSGCGGGVCAKNIAEAGQRVIVADKAYHFPPEYLPMTENDGAVHLFMNGGMLVSDDSSISIIAGQAWGGGGTVNWSASLQTQQFVRQEWADAGLPFFTSSEFQNCLDRVCDRMGVSTEFIEHNKTNRTLMEGARKLGYSCKAVPQNTGGKQHYCGYCTEGCGSAEKQGPVVSYLPDAARAGAHFVEGFDAQTVVFEKINGKRTATGVRGTWRSRDSNGGVSGGDRTSRQVFIKAKRVIVSGGTMQSPLLLLRSGLTNPHIGRNLHLHPVNVFGAIFDEETRPWEGGILTTVVDSLQDQDGRGHGVKLEAVTMLPSFMLPIVPWTSGLEYKELAARFKNMVGFISLARDRDTGRVYPDKTDGRCRVAYTPSAFDRAHILEGILALAKIAYVAGARTLLCMTAGIPTFTREDVPAGQVDQGVNEPRFKAWLEAVRNKGLNMPEATFAAAHQMGTCRMAKSERLGVVDALGKVWGTDGLYVADASTFPSASGVNPMVTTMAIADWVSRGVANEARAEGRREGARL